MAAGSIALIGFWEECDKLTHLVQAIMEVIRFQGPISDEENADQIRVTLGGIAGYGARNVATILVVTRTHAHLSTVLCDPGATEYLRSPSCVRKIFCGLKSNKI